MLVFDFKITAALKNPLVQLERQLTRPPRFSPRVEPADLAVPSAKRRARVTEMGKGKKGEARREKGRENGTVIKWSPRLWKGSLAEWRQGWCYDCWQGRGHDCLRQRNPSYFRYQGHKTKANRPSTAPFKDISSEGILFERTAHRVSLAFFSCDRCDFQEYSSNRLIVGIFIIFIKGRNWYVYM